LVTGLDPNRIRPLRELRSRPENYGQGPGADTAKLLATTAAALEWFRNRTRLTKKYFDQCEQY
jgi:hypothetical protein